jgi:hypothetical protein
MTAGEAEKMLDDAAVKLGEHLREKCQLLGNSVDVLML